MVRIIYIGQKWIDLSDKNSNVGMIAHFGFDMLKTVNHNRYRWSMKNMIWIYDSMRRGQILFFLTISQLFLSWRVKVTPLYWMILNMVSVFDVIDYPVVSIEDPFDQDDWENTKILTACGVCQVGVSVISANLFLHS